MNMLRNLNVDESAPQSNFNDNVTHHFLQKILDTYVSCIICKRALPFLVFVRLFDSILVMLTYGRGNSSIVYDIMETLRFLWKVCARLKRRVMLPIYAFSPV